MQAKVADLGVAKGMLDEEQTRSSGSREEHTLGVGTLRYMAPELLTVSASAGGDFCSCRGQYTTAADVFSFGLLLWEVVHRQIIFSCMSPLQSRIAMEGGPESMEEHLGSTIAEDAPRAVTDLIRDCWITNAAERPSMQAVAKRLRTMVEGMVNLSASLHAEAEASNSHHSAKIGDVEFVHWSENDTQHGKNRLMTDCVSLTEVPRVSVSASESDSHKPSNVTPVASTAFTAVLPTSAALELQVDAAGKSVERLLVSVVQWAALQGVCGIILLACFWRSAAGFHMLGKAGMGILLGHLLTRWLLGAHRQSQVWLFFLLVPTPILTAASLLVPSEDFISLHESVKDAVCTTVMFFLWGAGHAAHKRSPRWKACTAAAFCVLQFIGQLLITHVHSYASYVTFYAMYAHLPFLAGLCSGHLCTCFVSELISGELSPVRASLREAERRNG